MFDGGGRRDKRKVETGQETEQSCKVRIELSTVNRKQRTKGIEEAAVLQFYNVYESTTVVSVEINIFIG